MMTRSEVKTKALDIKNKVCAWTVGSEQVMSERLNECSCEELGILCKYYQTNIGHLTRRMFRLEALGRG